MFMSETIRNFFDALKNRKKNRGSEGAPILAAKSVLNLKQ
jgi:hypothetical protein